MVQEIKSYFFNKKLKSDIENNSINRIINNLNDVTSVGVVFDGTSFQSIHAIHDFEVQLKKMGKQVEIFGYINTNDAKTDSILITNKNLNWYGYPTKKELFNFAEKKFDVIFGIFYDLDSPLNVIFANSKSKLRIGPLANKNENLFDVLISIDKGLSIVKIIQVLTEFLNKVKTR